MPIDHPDDLDDDRPPPTGPCPRCCKPIPALLAGLCHGQYSDGSYWDGFACVGQCDACGLHVEAAITDDAYDRRDPIEWQRVTTESQRQRRRGKRRRDR
ncbi:MAG: hypothetical protein AAGA57_11110 [Planctomycetota bacterium]